MTWLAQIVMFVLLGLLAWPERLPQQHRAGARGRARTDAGGAPGRRVPVPGAVPLLVREKVFISWVGLRGAVGIFLASIPLLVGLPNAQLYFDVGFVVVLVSLLSRAGPSRRPRGGCTSRCRAHDPPPRRVELDLPGQLAQELVGYRVGRNSPYLRRRLMPSWAKPMLVVRNEQVLSPRKPSRCGEGDYVYVLAPPEKAQALDRFFVDMPPPAAPDPRLLGDFFVSGDVHARRARGHLWAVDRAEDAEVTLADHFAEKIKRRPKQGDVVAARADRAGGASGGERPPRQRRLAAGARRGAGDAYGQAQEGRARSMVAPGVISSVVNSGRLGGSARAAKVAQPPPATLVRSRASSDALCAGMTELM